MRLRDATVGSASRRYWLDQWLAMTDPSTKGSNRPSCVDYLPIVPGSTQRPVSPCNILIMTSIIVATFPWYGETLPLLELARGLVGRGHQVVVAAGSRFREMAVATGARFVPLTGAADYDDRRLDETFPGRAHVEPGLAQNVFDTSYILGDAIPDQYRLLSALIAENQDSVLITNAGMFGAWPFALGAPGPRPRRWVAVGVNPLYLASADTTPFGPAPVPVGSSAEDAREANWAANAGIADALSPATEHVRAVLAAVGCTKPIKDLTDAMVTLPDAFAELSVAELDFPRSDAPASLSFVGLLPSPPTASWSEPPWWPELDQGQAVVVVTQGTIANHDLSQLVEPTLAALTDHDVLVVAALGRQMDALTDVPDNVRVTEYVPFDVLLPRADVLVTNGGFGSTQQALAAGTPVVVAGSSEDKAPTAARIAFHGVGVSLDTATPTPAQVRRAVEDVLGDGAFRERARAMAKAYARYDALTLIERLAIS